MSERSIAKVDRNIHSMLKFRERHAARQILSMPELVEQALGGIKACAKSAFDGSVAEGASGTAAENPGEVITDSLIRAVGQTGSLDRLLSIDRDRRPAFNIGRITLDQARRVRLAVDARRAEIRLRFSG